MLRLFIAALALWLAGCPSDDGVLCKADSDCQNGLVCSDGVCVAGVACEPACAAGQSCKAGACVADGCAPACAAGETCTDGKCVAPSCSPACGAGELCQAGSCVPKPCTPACASGFECKAGACVEKACSPACGAGFLCKLGGCVANVTAIAITTPAAGTIGPAPLAVTADVAASALDKLPQTIAGTATPVGGGTAEAFSLTRTAGTGSKTYSGTWTPAGANGTAYKLKVTDSESQVSSPEVAVSLDKLGPALTVAVVPRTGSNTSKLVVLDPNEPTAFALGSVARVKVTCAEADLDSASVGVTVSVPAALGSGAVTAMMASGQPECAGATGYCAVGEVKLAGALKVNAFSGALEVKGSAKDKIGNAGSSNTATLKVTRWKWAYTAAAGAIKGAPALGKGGVVYFGTADSAGKVFSVKPDGTDAWTSPFTTGGPVEASPAVLAGSGAANDEVAIVGKGTTGGAVWLLKAPPSGTVTPDRENSGWAAGKASPGIARLQLTGDTQPLATVFAPFAVSSTGLLAIVRPGSPSQDYISRSADKPAEATSGIALSAGAGGAMDVYFGDAIGRVQGFSLALDGSANTKTGFPAAITTGNRPANPVAVGTDVVGGGNGIGTGTVFSLRRADGTAKTPYDPQSPAWNAVASSSAILVGDDAGKLHFVKYSDPSSLTQVRAPLDLMGGPISAAPALGSDGSIYVADQTAVVSALKSDGTKLWSVTLGSGNAIYSSPNLDCARDSAGAVDKSVPGVLYVGADDGKLYAIVVDSQGLDVSAPWPRFHRDPGNSADASVNLADVVCK